MDGARSGGPTRGLWQVEPICPNSKYRGLPLPELYSDVDNYGFYGTGYAVDHVAGRVAVFEPSTPLIGCEVVKYRKRFEFRSPHSPMSRTVVLTVLDSLRYDIFQEYVSSAPADSFLTGLVESGTTFHGATAMAPWSLPSVDVATRIDPDTETLVSAASDAGFDTACFTANPWVSPEFGFDGWDKHRNYTESPYPDAVTPDPASDGVGKYVESVQDIIASDSTLKSFLNAAYKKMDFFSSLFDSGGNRMTQDACSYLDDAGNDDCFLFFNYMETHASHGWLARSRMRNLLERRKQDRHNRRYNVSYYREYGEHERLTDQYVRSLMTDELRYVDSLLGRLWETLTETGRAEECLFIFCSDHGDGLGENGFGYHVSGVTEPILRTPLVVSAPEEQPDEIVDRASLGWIAPTVYRYFGIDAGLDLLEPSTYPELVGAENTDRITRIVDDVERLPEMFIEDRVAAYRTNDPTIKYVRTEERDSVWEIERKGLDEEVQGSGGTELLDSFVQGFESSSNAVSPVSEGTLNDLEDLGYL
jgi:arylsulfatase A-like enzyme